VNGYSFPKQKEAQHAANNLRQLIDSGRISEVNKIKIKPNLMSFSEVSELLKKKWDGLLRQRDLKPKTHGDYVIRINALTRVFGDRLLCEISKEDLLGFRADVASDLSNVSANRNLFIIKQTFKHGMEIGAITEDPASQISYLSEKEHERNRFILPPDIDNLIDASQEIRAKFYMPALIFLGAEHGASRQEALSLKWVDIIFDYEGIGTIRLFRTKNEKERTEYLMPRTRKALIEWQKHQQWMHHRKKIEYNGANYVFCRLNGKPIKRFDKAWRSTCRIAGLKDFHFHDLRHTFCSNLLLSGSDLKDVKEMIGHSDLSMTDRYSHLTLGHKRHRPREACRAL
jgi:integrase